jgi:hypothetical protein
MMALLTTGRLPKEKLASQRDRLHSPVYSYILSKSTMSPHATKTLGMPLFVFFPLIYYDEIPCKEMYSSISSFVTKPMCRECILVR